jgi:hypothetical protein
MWAEAEEVSFMMDSAFGSPPPTFSEREFSDFRLYTLDKPATIENNSEKQLSLYPLKTVKYTRKYEYRVNQQNTDVLISFKNSAKDGLGLPLPAGNINFYEVDPTDKTQQFVGVGRIEHTSLDQDVSVRIGSAFDIVSETRILAQSHSGRTQTTDYEINLTNNKSETVEIEVIHQTWSGNIEILKPSIKFEKRDAFNYVFKVRVNSGRSVKLTFTERVTH